MFVKSMTMSDHPTVGGLPIFWDPHRPGRSCTGRSTHTIGWWSTWICRMSRRRRERCGPTLHGLWVDLEASSIVSQSGKLMDWVSWPPTFGNGLTPTSPNLQNLGVECCFRRLCSTGDSMAYEFPKTEKYTTNSNLGDVESRNPGIVALLRDF